MQAVVQLRGEVNMDYEITDTLEFLNLGAVNHCTLVPQSPAYDGMVQKVAEFVAFGEPSEAIVETLLARRGEPAVGPGPIDDEWVSEQTDYDGLAELAEALCAEETTLSEEGLAPVLRLHPPRGGHDGIKHPRGDGGSLGHHDREAIDALLQAMR